MIESRDLIMILYRSRSTRMTGEFSPSSGLVESCSSILEARSANWWMIPDIDWRALPLAERSLIRIRIRLIVLKDGD